MTLKKNGLNDSDKILVTIALWISVVTLFITALTLPMLPGDVMIFYRTADGTMPEKYSKYNNLLLVLIALVPTVIIAISAELKRRNRLQNSFVSVMLFSVMLSLSIGCIIIYGIAQQFGASGGIRSVNIHAIVVIVVSFAVSFFSAAFPVIKHRPGRLVKLDTDVTFIERVSTVADKHWSVGAYGFLAVAVASSFVPAYYAYIPFIVGVIAFLIFLFTCKPKIQSHGAEQQA